MQSIEMFNLKQLKNVSLFSNQKRSYLRLIFFFYIVIYSLKNLKNDVILVIRS